MKKFIIILIVSVSVICSFKSVNATDNENEDLSIENKIESNATMLIGQDIDIVEYRNLFDLNKEDNYILAITDNDGYVIVSKDNLNISELSLQANTNPYKNKMNNQLIYAGPSNYLYIDSENIIRNITDGSENNNFSEDLKEANETFLNTNFELPKTREFAWKGIAESRFSRYAGAGWINKSDDGVGYCGPYAAATLLAYFDDYIDNGIVPDSIRIRNSTSPGTLVSTMIRLTPKASETLPNHVGSGITTFMKNYSTTKVNASVDLYQTWIYVNTLCSKQRPILTGLLNALGSSYGDHWVLVYQIREDAEGKGWYKCVDNWGGYNKVIQSSWTMGNVWLPIY